MGWESETAVRSLVPWLHLQELDARVTLLTGELSNVFKSFVRANAQRPNHFHRKLGYFV